MGVQPVGERIGAHTLTAWLSEASATAEVESGPAGGGPPRTHSPAPARPSLRRRARWGRVAPTSGNSKRMGFGCQGDIFFIVIAI